MKIDESDKQKLIRRVERSYWGIDLDKLTEEELNKLYRLMEDFKVDIKEYDGTVLIYIEW